MISRFIASSFIIAASVLPLNISYAAGTNTPRLDQRQENQERRIEQGVESGTLNKREANRLNKTQDRIEQNEEKAKADGVVTKKERIRLQHQQNRASRHVFKQKHDRQHR